MCVYFYAINKFIILSPFFQRIFYFSVMDILSSHMMNIKRSELHYNVIAPFYVRLVFI